YDADGNQLIRRNPGKTTLSLATDELTLDTGSARGTGTSGSRDGDVGAGPGIYTMSPCVPSM
ncbi:hypothetical protein, partial [Kitasatospora sp. NPDC051702]|uniref:hypothetical protein n=1 Tax=Kitasatospora sp. NPDC051702 TaxID=3155672 RepID=UPI0034478646